MKISHLIVFDLVILQGEMGGEHYLQDYFLISLLYIRKL